MGRFKRAATPGPSTPPGQDRPRLSVSNRGRQSDCRPVILVPLTKSRDWRPFMSASDGALRTLDEKGGSLVDLTSTVNEQAAKWGLAATMRLPDGPEGVIEFRGGRPVARLAYETVGERHRPLTHFREPSLSLGIHPREAMTQVWRSGAAEHRVEPLAYHPSGRADQMHPPRR